MYIIEKTDSFDKWLNSLKDKTIVARILSRLYRAEKGNFGDTKPVGTNLFEMRFFFGSGYRLYYTIKDEKVIFLLCGGDKSSQKKDIEHAKKLME